MMKGRFSGRRTRNFQVVLVGMAVSLLLSGCGEPNPRLYRVGILSGLDTFAATVDGFKAKMTELGYIEGKTIAYETERTNFDQEAEERILRRFVDERVDLILVFPSEASVAAKEITRGTSIPVVFCQTNIEGTDLVRSVLEPGENLTGVRFPGPDIAVKRLEVLLELAPRAKRIWVPYGRNVPIVPDQLTALRLEAARGGIDLVEAPADGADDLLADLEMREKTADPGIDAILLISEPLAKTPTVFPTMIRFAYRHRIPVGGFAISHEGHSTVFGVATDNLAVGRTAAIQAHKVLRGIPASTIPVVSAESYFHINYRAAQELGLSVPEGLLRQANEIVR